MDRLYWISIIHKYYPNWDVSEMSDKQVAAIGIRLLDEHKNDGEVEDTTPDETVVEEQLEAKDVFDYRDGNYYYKGTNEIVSDDDLKDYLGKEDKNDDK